MAVNQTLEINYLIKAVDDATKTLKSVDSQLQKVESSTNEVQKATQGMSNLQQSVFNKIKDGYNGISDMANKYGVSLVAVTGFLALGVNKALDYADALAKNVNKAMEENIKLFMGDERAAISFNQVITSLEKSSNGVSGSLEEWNKVTEKTARVLGITKDETQEALKDIVLFSNGIGVSKKQIQDLIPVASNLALIHGTKLTQALDSVKMALNGQTRSLMAMGIVIKETDIEAFAKSIGRTAKSLSEQEKAQIRVNLIIQKASTLTGIAEKASQTLEFRIKKQTSQWEELRAEIGKGAAVIEGVAVDSWGKFLDLLESMPSSFLENIGVIGAVVGNLLSLTSTLVSVGIQIGLLVAGIFTLNAALTSLKAVEFIASLKESAFVVEALTGKFAPLTKAILSSADELTKSGITIASSFKVLGTVIVGLTAQFTALLIAAAPWIALAAAIGVAVYALFEVLRKIEQQTGIFSKAWESLTSLMSDSKIFEIITRLVTDFTGSLSDLFDVITTEVAVALIRMANFINEARIAYVLFSNWLSDTQIYKDVASAIDEIIIFFEDLIDTITDFGKKAGNILGGVVTGIKDFGKSAISSVSEAIGFSNLYADSLDYVDRSISQAAESKKGLNEQDQKSIELIQGQINYNQSVIEKLRSRVSVEKEVAATALASGVVSVESNKKQLASLDALDSALQAIKLSSSEEIVMAVSSAGVSSAFKEVTNQIVEMKKNIKEAKDEDLPGLIDKLKSLESKAIEIKFYSGISSALEIGKALGSGAKDVLKLAGKAIGTAIAGPFGNMIGDMIAQVIDIFGGDPEKFSQMIMQTIQEIPRILANVLINVLATLPKAVADGLILMLDQLPSIIDQVINAVVTTFTNPSFWIKVALQLTVSIIKSIPKIAEALTIGLVKNFAKNYTQAFKGLSNIFSSLGKTFSNVGSIFQKIGNVFSGVFKSLSGIFDFIKKNIIYLLAPLLLPLAPFIAAVYVLYQVIKNFDAIVKFFMDGIKKYIEFVSKIPSMIIDAITKGLVFIVEFLFKIPLYIIDGFIKAFEFITEGIKQLVNLAISYFTEFVTGFITILTDSISAVVDFFLNLPVYIVDAVAALVGVIWDVLEEIPGMFLKIVNIFKDSFIALFNVLKTIFNTVIDAIKSIPSKIVDAGTEFIKKIVNAGSEFINAIVTGAGIFVSELIKKIPGVGGAGNAIADAGNAILNVVGSVPIVGKPIQTELEKAKEKIESAFGIKFAQGGIPAMAMAMPQLKAANGLIVPGSSTTGDKVPVRVNSREMILTLDQQARLFKMIQEDSLGRGKVIELHTTVELDNRELGKAIDRLQVNGWRK